MRWIYSLFAVTFVGLLAGAAQAQPTPSLTPLTPAQQAAQAAAVKNFDEKNYAAALPVFTALAAAGDARSENALGMMYFYGLGVPQDQDQGVGLVSQAAAQHYGRAEDRLGRFYREQWIYDKSFAWFTLAAQDDDPQGESDLGHAYHYGIGTGLDYSKALYWDQKAAAQDDANGENGIATIYRYGQGVPRDYALALKYYHLAAAHGLSDGLSGIGDMYMYGEGVPVDYKLARQYLEKSLKGGCACAATSIGYMYETGLGVPASEAMAFKWYGVAANGGDGEGESDFGEMYETGRGTPKDIQKAVYWYQQSASEGNADGERNLGDMYLAGTGVEQNASEAARLYQEAAAQNNQGAQTKLGMLYLDGTGVQQNTSTAQQYFDAAAGKNDGDGEENVGWELRNDQHYALALKYFTPSAEQGNPEAQINLGYMYETGEAVPQSYEAELKWALITRSLLKYGHPDFDYRPAEIDNLINVHMDVSMSHMRPGQIAKAKHEARLWLAAHNTPFDDEGLPAQTFDWMLMAEAIIAILCVYGLAKSMQRRRSVADRGAKIPLDGKA